MAKSTRITVTDAKPVDGEVMLRPSAELVDVFDVAGPPEGLENVTVNDLIIPRITILQALSPQLNAKKPEYITDAKMGMFCDTGIGDTYTELELLPCFYAKVWLEWAPRSTGKGLVHNHGMDPSVLKRCRPDEKNRPTTPEGNYVAETATFYCLNKAAGWRRSFVPLSSTQLKAGRKWLTLITAERLKRQNGTEFQPPIYYRTWLASSVEQSNAEGDWFGWKFQPGTPINSQENWEELLLEVQNFYHDAKDGLVKGDLSVVDADPNLGPDAPM